MQTRPVGNTGLEIGIIGLGAEHLDNKPYEVADEVIGAALDNGINFMDLFMPGEAVRANIGRAAVDLLLRRVSEPERPLHRIILSPRLNVRESTAPAPVAMPR